MTNIVPCSDPDFAQHLSECIVDIVTSGNCFVWVDVDIYISQLGFVQVYLSSNSFSDDISNTLLMPSYIDRLIS